MGRRQTLLSILVLGLVLVVSCTPLVPPEQAGNEEIQTRPDTAAVELQQNLNIRQVVLNEHQPIHRISQDDRVLTPRISGNRWLVYSSWEGIIVGRITTQGFSKETVIEGRYAQTAISDSGEWIAAVKWKSECGDQPDADCQAKSVPGIDIFQLREGHPELRATITATVLNRLVHLNPDLEKYVSEYSGITILEQKLQIKDIDWSPDSSKLGFILIRRALLSGTTMESVVVVADATGRLHT